MSIYDKHEDLISLGMPAQELECYKEPHRFYHTIAHLDDLYMQLCARNLDNNAALLLAIVYHDIVYDPKSSTNKEDSAKYFCESFRGDESLKTEVMQIILDTKTHQATTSLSATFCEMDLDILNRPFGELMMYEQQIFKEFQFVNYKIYREKRVEVLLELRKQVNNPALDALITYVECRKPHIAVYPGSFNPFHKGHYNILQKAEQIFDKVIVARGINLDKATSSYPLPNLIGYRQCTSYEGLLTDFTNALGYDVTVIRGLRNSTDLQYELNQYRYLQELSNKTIKIISIFCDPEYEHISSSAIRQLDKYGKSAGYLV